MAAKWTDAERDIVRAIWKTPSLLKCEVPVLPGRTFASIAKEASKLGLGRKAHVASHQLERAKVLMADRKPRSSKEIARAINAGRSHLHVLLVNAVERGEFHIAGYGMAPRYRRNEACFKIGKGKSAGRPTKLTEQEKGKRFRDNVDPIEHKFKRKQYTLNRKIKTGAIKRDPLTEAFFGGGAA
ncbi:hypothetical protein RI103_06170 [Paraburkholderia sp. FT54]|uniref:hypothetical protein n=1 Tax=Paraburkholderia sp. FT54 TaxID=3074437 RepID=UPI002878081C|nr:hypothetical protein [Paraburkholderia sp. FT54]WNC90933.1 hypothetical protein RI103_06170 [Paraburkholderia sp. FT54]